MCPSPVASARRTFPALSRHFVRLLRKLPTSHELILMCTTIGLFKFPPSEAEAKVVYKCPTQALELIFSFLVKSKISTSMTVTFLWTLFSELSAHRCDFFLKTPSYSKTKHVYSAGKTCRFRFKFPTKVEILFPGTGDGQIPVSFPGRALIGAWYMVNGFLKTSSHTLISWTFNLCLPFPAGLRSLFKFFFSTALWQLKKLPTFWWKRKHGWNVNTLDMFDVWFSIFLNSLCDSLDTIVDREIENGIKL